MKIFLTIFAAALLFCGPASAAGALAQKNFLPRSAYVYTPDGVTADSPLYVGVWYHVLTVADLGP